MSWSVLLILTAITFFNRFAFFTQGLKYQPGPRLQRFLGYSSYAILTALWAPIIFSFRADGDVSIAGWDYLLAATVAAALTMARVRSILVVLISTTVFFVLRTTLFSLNATIG